MAQITFPVGAAVGWAYLIQLLTFFQISKATVACMNGYGGLTDYQERKIAGGGKGEVRA